MKDSIISPPEKDLNSIMTVADQGQGGLEEKTRSNSTTQLSIALTKDSPAITTPKRISKRNPSKTAEDGAMTGRSLLPSEVAQGQVGLTAKARSNLTTPLLIDLTKDNPDPTNTKSHRKQPPPSKTAKDGAVQGRPLVAYNKNLKVSKFHRLYKKAWRKEVFGNQAFITWSSRTAEYSGRAISKCPGWWTDVNMDPSSDTQTYDNIAAFILTGLNVLTSGRQTEQRLMAIPPGIFAPHLNQQGITTIDSLKEFNDGMLDDIHKHITRHGPPNVVFSALSLSRLKAAASAVRFYLATGRALTAACMRWTNTLIMYQEEREALKIAQEREDPKVPCVSKALPIMKWLAAFRSIIHESYGVRGFPLGYVLRENADVPAEPPLAPDRPYSIEHGSLVAEFTARASHTHPRFHQDNARVFAKLEEALRGTTYASSLTPFEQTRDGRGAFFAIVAQYLVEGKGNGTFPLERFIGGHRNAHQALLTASQHVEYQIPNEHTRIGYLLWALHTTDPGLHATIANIEGNEDPNGPRYSFEECARLLQLADPVAKKNKRSHAQISDTTVTIDESANQTIEIASLRSGIGKTGVHLRFYKKKEFDKLPAEQRAELKAWRKISAAAFEKELKRRVKQYTDEEDKKKGLHDTLVSALKTVNASGKMPAPSASTDVSAIVLGKILGRKIDWSRQSPKLFLRCIGLWSRTYPGRRWMTQPFQCPRHSLRQSRLNYELMLPMLSTQWILDQNLTPTPM
ncbi:unnamed protein product [Cylindrotheca closterium]|uniref:Uncharacterized protein n=1 Tax=Cylindrotheca closterium TaxID=2856 RepID=A0AAD2G8B2_9STRA|nr:unnamed protein product [Cylindrotheca closterium]